MNWQSPDGSSGRQRSRWSGWRIAGVVLATVVGILGLVALMALIFFVVAVNSIGGNK